MNALLACAEFAGADALRLLVGRDVEVAAVLAGPPPEGEPDIPALAAELGIPSLEPGLVRDPAFAGWIEERGIDLLLNVYALPIIAPGVLAAPRIGSFNLHPGPLPDYRGLNAASWAVAEGERRHAATLHWVSPEVDAGPIAYDSWFEVGESDNGLAVAARCEVEGMKMLERLLGDAQRGSIPMRPQPARAGSWHGREVPREGVISWDLGARTVVDLVRAADHSPRVSPWGPFEARIGETEVAILRASTTGEPTDAPAGTVGRSGPRGTLVSAGDEWVLVEAVAASRRVAGRA